jgi:SAM-dependent methyltransferase
MAQLQETFDVIECCGVLHHMDDPATGLHRLVEKLRVGGLIKLGLYSRHARTSITEARQNLSTGAANATFENAGDGQIRRIRNRLIAGDLRGQYPSILASEDFYSLSGCRDLLFHPHEVLFSPEALDQLCQAAGLQFLGFTGLSATVRQNFRSRFPEDTAMTGLANWAQFETEFPDTFARMYQFFCQK